MTTATSSPIKSGAFHTTRWTRVCLAKSDSEDGRRALADLCDAYYEPVVTFLSCELRDRDSARDLTHAFFAEMLSGGRINTVDRERGRFRSYLLGAVKHFLAHRRESARRMKRGGGQERVSMDDDEVIGVAAEGRRSPDREFDRQWAVTVLSRGLEALRAEFQAEMRENLFEQVKPLLTGEVGHGQQSELAAACGLSVAAFRMMVHRTKKRLRQCVKEEISGTLEDPAMIEEEMQALFVALGG